jgi:hypothetical protein
MSITATPTMLSDKTKTRIAMEFPTTSPNRRRQSDVERRDFYRSNADIKTLIKIRRVSECPSTRCRQTDANSRDADKNAKQKEHRYGILKNATN